MLFNEHAAVSTIRSQLQEICPDIEVYNYIFCGQDVSQVTIRLPYDGNGAVIKKLEKDGWVPLKLERIRHEDEPRTMIRGWNPPKEGVLYQRLSKMIEEESYEENKKP